MDPSLWLRDWPASTGLEPLRELRTRDLRLWQAQDGSFVRAYLQAAAAPPVGWVRLEPLRVLTGASAGAVVACHYVVETDVLPAHEAELNAWYEQEHLPGLARVSGTVRAWRYRRETGGPRYLACYDLTAADTLNHPDWLAVRHTAWSSRVRPLFVNPRRQMFVPAQLRPGA